MNLRLIEKSLKFFYLKAESKINKQLGREFIPTDLGAFNIEPSSSCNLKCRFCAYEKKESARVNMPNDMFISAVEQALALGFTEFHLTPTTGDVFMDKQIFEKLHFLDNHPDVKAYHFFTNLTILNPDQIKQLTQLKKLSRISISIYGHDEQSFIQIAKSSSKVFKRLILNLQTLLDLKNGWPFLISFGFRSTFDVPKEPVDELMLMLQKFKQVGVNTHASHGIYNNWGGYILQDDVKDLNIKILDGTKTYKLGPCVKLFDGFQVMATGVVNGCACRDVDATLEIGKIQETPLKDLLTINNPLYMKIIEEQEAGNFRPICEGCDYYRSIYHQPSSYRKHGTPVQNQVQFFSRFSAGETNNSE
jgi:sulfatase maturation enzyme AslB (radical SAM superfamily)